jgi:hypothetical protein
MNVPLWISVPVVLCLWLSSWISSMDPTGSSQDSTILWTLSAIATMAVVLQSTLRRA